MKRRIVQAVIRTGGLTKRWLLAVFTVLLFAVVTACSSDNGRPAGADPESAAPITSRSSGSEGTGLHPEAIGGSSSTATHPPAATSPIPAGVVPSPPLSQSESSRIRTGGANNELDQMALGVVAHLSQELGPRASGTEQERKAAQYLVSQLEQFGYAAWLQEFTVTTLSPSTASLTLAPMESGPDALSVGVAPLSRSSTGEVKGRLVPAGLARPHELPAEGLAGNIALVERGLITFQEKVDRLAEAGAVGAVIYNNAPGNFRGTLREVGPIPVVSISQEDGARIQELLAAGTVEAVLTVNQEVHPSQNVIAEKPGGPDAIGVVVLGAHYDTVPDVPGANDNASGTAVLLTLAEQLQNQPLPFTVRFIGFGSEELGLRGSRHYLDSLSEQQRRDITAMFNFDSLGSGESLGVLGDGELVGRLVEIGKEMGIDVRSSSPLRGGSSDHTSFQRLGIPAVMFVSRDSSRIHTSGDTLEHVNARLLGDAVRLALGLLESGEPLAGKSP